MFQEVQQILNQPKRKEALKKALFEQTDLNQVKILAAEMRQEVQQTIRRYQSHAEEGGTYGKGNTVVAGENGPGSRSDTGIGKACLQ